MTAPACARRARSALTFVELLLAMAIMSIIGMGLASHLRAGIGVWRRSQRDAEQAQRLRVTWWRLSRDLANAVRLEPPDDPAPDTELSTDHLAFYTSEPAVGASPGGLWQVTYELRSADASASPAAGDAAALELVRRARRPGAAEPTEAVLLRDLESWRIEYPEAAEELPTLEDPAWRFVASPWPVEQGLPRLVRLTVVPAGAGPEASRQWQWLFGIPHGVIASHDDAG
jgi:hypothetical protein